MSSLLCSSLSRAQWNKATVTQLHFVRHKGNVQPHRKPRWLGIAKSKMYKNPPRDMTPLNETVQVNILAVKYQEHLSALSQYLYEDYLKNSDVGEAAKIEAEKEEEALRRNIEENRKENVVVAEKREARRERERAEKEREILRRREEIEAGREAERRGVEERVRREAEALSKRVTAEGLEAAIVEALDNPKDYEYAIDVQGHIYRGRYTKSNTVPEEEREKIPVPSNPRDFLESEGKN